VDEIGLALYSYSDPFSPYSQHMHVNLILHGVLSTTSKAPHASTRVTGYDSLASNTTECWSQMIAIHFHNSFE
jgi:hypothetical protein